MSPGKTYSLEGGGMEAKSPEQAMIESDSFMDFLEEISEQTTSKKIPDAERVQLRALFLKKYTQESDDEATRDLMGIAMRKFLEEISVNAKSQEQFYAAKAAVMAKFKEMQMSLEEFGETGKYPEEKAN